MRPDGAIVQASRQACDFPTLATTALATIDVQKVRAKAEWEGCGAILLIAAWTRFQRRRRRVSFDVATRNPPHAASGFRPPEQRRPLLAEGHTLFARPLQGIGGPR